MGISWAIRSFIKSAMLGSNSLFRGHEMYQFKIYVTFKTYKNSYSWLCKLLMVHENNQLRISLNFMTQVNTMKSEIPVFMAMVQGFFNTFCGIFMKKRDSYWRHSRRWKKTVRHSFVIKHIHDYHLRNIEMEDTMAYYQKQKQPLVWTAARSDAMAERTGRKPSPGQKHRSWCK